ncbi:anti-sigma factor antagonist [Amycolatopsis sp. CA-126428]|uniref:anti-sigma factor antagonist n=1 Tax=Amycolatopsis sp. CA-126428 TaxID=2073158 RepID=UPI0013049D9F|nr:anti-sigma factor antagonist [Amycolatopsis sp. CA-126428]
MTFPEPETGGFPAASSAAVSVSLRHVETALVLDVGGEVDLVTAPELNDAVTAALAEAPTVLIVDLTAVTFFSSAGLAVLFDLQSKAGPATAVRVAATSVAARPMAITGADRLMPVFATLAEALLSEHPAEPPPEHGDRSSSGSSQ